MNGGKLLAAHPFKVKWLDTLERAYSRFNHLKNPLNNDKLVFFARDGQEYPVDVGKEMVAIMQ